MASASGGWPQFIKTFDEWRERKARAGGGNSNGLRSSARSAERPHDNTIQSSSRLACRPQWMDNPHRNGSRAPPGLLRPRAGSSG
jgi:hypothetical protein